MTGRPSRYPIRRQPSPDAAALALEFQRPPAEPMPSPGQDPATASEAAPEAHEPRPGQGRDALLARITGARVPYRQLCLLVLEAEGLSAFTDGALRRMVAVLDAIETRDDAPRNA